MWEIGSRGIYSRLVSDLKDDWVRRRVVQAAANAFRPARRERWRKRLLGAADGERQRTGERLAAKKAHHANGVH